MPEGHVEYVTHSELDAAIAAVKDDIADTEQRLRKEWTDTVRYEVGRMDKHLDDQDVKFNWMIGLQFTLLLAVMSGLIYFLLHLLGG
jgi:hypothetical protein